MSENYFYYYPKSKYPNTRFFSPSIYHLEYPFDRKDISSRETNDVYEMTRNIFKEKGFDSANSEKKIWNPLGGSINPGDTVLIKPNMVNNINPAECDEDRGLQCLITHPAIVRCIFDYVYIALQGRGKIIIGDAPVQDCNYDDLVRKSGYLTLFEFIKSKETRELEVVIDDLRETTLLYENGVVIQKERGKTIFDSTIVDLKEKSYFSSIKKNKKLRITNYSGSETVQHHINGKNEYCISNAALEADVIINICKPKTHRIAGYTGALKNLIGINARKEYLPHHQKGGALLGGDEYAGKNGIIKYINSTGNDLKNWMLKNHYTKMTRRFNCFCKWTGKILDKKEAQRKKFGMWYGNDTIWRTILDVNRIILYADRRGKLQKTKQRKMLCFGDMIVCGEGEGPLRPNYKYVGGILYSDNPVEFDLIQAKLMGFCHEKFPVLKNAIKDKKLYNGQMDIRVESNSEYYNKHISEIQSPFKFEPSNGWKEYLI